MQALLPSWKDTAISKKQVQIPWKSLQLLVPHRLRRKLRSKLRNRSSPASSIATLQTSFSPVDTLRSLQNHRWTLYDGQWLFLAVVGIFSLSIIESPGPLVKTAVATFLLASLIFPVTRQFFRPFMPIAAYLIFFYACRYVISDAGSLFQAHPNNPGWFKRILILSIDSSPQNGGLLSGSRSSPPSKTFCTAPT